MNLSKSCFICILCILCITGCNDDQAYFYRVKAQIAQCWDIPKDPVALSEIPIVTIDVQMNTNATIQSMEVTPSDAARYKSDPVFAKAANNAMKALKKCSPITALHQREYVFWKNLSLIFNPQENPL